MKAQLLIFQTPIPKEASNSLLGNLNASQYIASPESSDIASSDSSLPKNQKAHPLLCPRRGSYTRHKVTRQQHRAWHPCQRAQHPTQPPSRLEHPSPSHRQHRVNPIR
ncbi:hypothetical protein BDV97DRAFT_194848 [Delphinella strobiligena]|nr:hypothetical protein BDV97DRAFT_194848 [Delphinella strobiligena]